MELIEIENDGGTLSGYIVPPKQEQIQVYLSQYFPENVAERMTQFFRNNVTHEIVVVKNVNVDESKRGLGYGNALLSALFESYTDNADAIVLLADRHEEQKPGFVLQNFYAGFDFEETAETNIGTLMVYPPDLAEKMKQYLQSFIVLADFRP